MSAGHVHTKASFMLASGFLLGTYLFKDLTGLQYALGAAIGVMITPDCDVDAGTIHGKYIRERLGWIGEKVWDIIWHFYRKSLKHGSELSHFPIVSTLGRLAYLLLVLIVLPTLLLSMFLDINVLGVVNWWYVKLCQNWAVILGLMGSDFIHWGLDILTTEHKKKNVTQSSKFSNRQPNKSFERQPVQQGGDESLW